MTWVEKSVTLKSPRLRNELLLSIQRQADFETRFAGLGFEFNFSSVTIADYAIAYDESKPSAGPDGLGREKRLEEMRLQIRRNAGAVIHDFNDKLVVFEAGANADFSRAVNRVNGVVDEIGPNLIEFAAVSHDGRHGAIERARHRHVFQFVAENSQGALDAIVDVDLLHRRLVHVGVRADGFDERSDPFGALLDLAQ